MPRISNKIDRSEPISERLAQSYINFLRKRGAVIVEPTPIPIWTSSISERSINYKANEWLKELEKYRNLQPPYFFLLNLGVDDSGEKHAIVVSFTPNPQTKHCEIHYFDPNGAIDYERSIRLPLTRGLRIFPKILEKLIPLLRENFDCQEIYTPIDDMRELKSINVVGGGNCNALSLWYITKRFLHGNKVRENIIELSRQIEKNAKVTTYKINDDILFLSKLKTSGKIYSVDGTFYV